MYVVIIDKKKKLLNCIGPIPDDTMWVKRFYKALDKGRRVFMYTDESVPFVTQLLEQECVNYTDEPLI